jgi:hypothetical protein
VVQNRADQDVTGFLAVEHDMGLKREAADARDDFVRRAPGAGEGREEVECPFQPGMVGLGMVCAEILGGALVDFDEVLDSTFRQAEIRHGGRGCVLWSEHPPWWRCSRCGLRGNSGLPL